MHIKDLMRQMWKKVKLHEANKDSLLFEARKKQQVNSCC